MTAMLAEAIEFHGLPAIRWKSREGACAIATLQGAHLVSWTLPGGEECLYVSERSAFEPGRAVRGGIPVCFPQFADRGALAQHGFARTQAWSFAGASEGPQGSTATFVLVSSQATLAPWPHEFRVELAATLADRRLEVALRILNTGVAPFAFTAALHTYLRISDAANARVVGLQGMRFMHRGATQVATEHREAIPAGDPVDRVYFAAPRATRVEDAGRVIHLEQRGFTDTVVWNPGRERTAQMADMPPEGYRQMLCVEAAAIEPAIALAASQEWSGAQSLAVA